jgi:hypothetical protein
MLENDLFGLDRLLQLYYRMIINENKNTIIINVILIIMICGTLGSITLFTIDKPITILFPCVIFTFSVISLLVWIKYMSTKKTIPTGVEYTLQSFSNIDDWLDKPDEEKQK